MGTLYIVSTPIGNLEDITVRAIRTLFTVDTIACEDTRRTGLLLQELKKRYGFILQQCNNVTMQQFIRYDDREEQSQTPMIIEQLRAGKSVALVSDAGTPLISDPGYKLVSEALKRGIKVVSIPGPTAAIAALTVSGLPTNQFLFLGYPPEKEKHRKDLFQNLSTMKQLGNLTIVFYCAPHKFLQTLSDIKEVLGDIDIVVARELTKVHEEVWEGSITETLQKFDKPVGEFVFFLKA